MSDHASDAKKNMAKLADGAEKGLAASVLASKSAITSMGISVKQFGNINFKKFF